MQLNLEFCNMRPQKNRVMAPLWHHLDFSDHTLVEGGIPGEEQPTAGSRQEDAKNAPPQGCARHRCKYIKPGIKKGRCRLRSHNALNLVTEKPSAGLGPELQKRLTEIPP